MKKKVVGGIKSIFLGRPIWMNLLMTFCAYMTFIYMPFDIFYKPVSEDAEVWFGFMLHGWAAKATAPFHWLIYAAGFFGFLKMKPWMFPWAAIYVLQVAIGMAVWSWLYNNTDWWIGALVGLPFLFLAAMLWRAKGLFRGIKSTSAGDDLLMS